MKTISPALSAHLAQTTTTLAMCVKLTRRDTTVYGFTSHDKLLVISGLTYEPAKGLSPLSITSLSTLEPGTVEVEGVLSSDAITETDMRAGRFDYAEVEIFMVNYTDLSQGTLNLKTGYLGEVHVRDGQFTADVRGLNQRLSQTIGELYSASCRAKLGDARCKVSLASHTVTGSITSVVAANYDVIDSTRSEASGIFTSGIITFTSGANNGLSMEVKEYFYTAASGGRITLALPIPSPIAVGTTYSLVKGCDKTIETCFSRFNNVVNFRGEPHVPGLDRSMETAGTRSNW